MPRISAERSRSQRERIVTGAIQVFAERGYGPTTVDSVCQACGLSKGAVYTYFASKEELFVGASNHVFEERYRALAQQVDGQADRPADGHTERPADGQADRQAGAQGDGHGDGQGDEHEAAARIDALVDRFTGTLLRTDGSFLRLWVEGFLLAAHIPALADLKRSYHVRFGELLERALLEAQASGALDPQLDVAAAAQAVMALADGLMLYTLVPGLGPAPEQVAAVLAGVSALLGRQAGS